jgi:hypothetical protein
MSTQPQRLCTTLRGGEDFSSLLLPHSAELRTRIGAAINTAMYMIRQDRAIRCARRMKTVMSVQSKREGAKQPKRPI